ncbi:MAG: phage portal protein, partial [Clostridia bacterium]
MKIKLFGKTIEFRNATSSLPPPSDDAAWATYLAGKGFSINATTALKVAAVVRCVDVISKTVASLPLALFETVESGREKAVKHPIYRVISRLPNVHTTAYEFWYMYVANLLLTRGAFAKIERDRRGFITGMRNIPTAKCSPIYKNELNGERYIHVTDDGMSEILHDGEFMYTPGMRFSSDTDPEDPMRIAADVLGLTSSLNDYAQKAFEYGTNPGGFIEHPGALSEAAYERFKSDFYKNYMGAMNAHKWLFLEEGAKASP